MNCREHQSNLIELSRGGSVRTGGERELRDHAGRCPECARLLERQQKLSGAMHNLAAQAAAILPPEDLGKRVRAELDTFYQSSEARQRDRQIGIGGLHVRSSRRWIPVIGGAIAASVLAGWLLLGRRAVEPGGKHDGPSAAAAPDSTQQETTAIRPSAAGATIPAGAPEPAVARVVKTGGDRQTTRATTAGETRAALPGAAPVTTAAAGATPGEASEPFIAIPYTEPIAPYERASVMRMDLPAAAVMAAGLPLETRDAGERVQADVLVGEDGRARAIRLLYVSNASIDRRQ
jgi:hypothetical protein